MIKYKLMLFGPALPRFAMGTSSQNLAASRARFKAAAFVKHPGPGGSNQEIHEFLVASFLLKPTTEQNMITLEWFSVAGFSVPGPGAQFGEDVDKVPLFQRSGPRMDLFELLDRRS